jgi:hypothetical protein
VLPWVGALPIRSELAGCSHPPAGLPGDLGGGLRGDLQDDLREISPASGSHRLLAHRRKGDLVVDCEVENVPPNRISKICIILISIKVQHMQQRLDGFLSNATHSKSPIGDLVGNEVPRQLPTKSMIVTAYPVDFARCKSDDAEKKPCLPQIRDQFDFLNRQVSTSAKLRRRR